MKNISISQRLKTGWSKTDIMRYYALDEKQYSKVLASLEEIEKKRSINK